MREVADAANPVCVGAALEADALCFDILVAPRASRQTLGPVVGDRLKVAIKAPPVDGEANSALVALIAKAFGVRKKDVRIVSGARGRRKRVRVVGGSFERLRALL